jgi:hypothetical protein
VQKMVDADLGFTGDARGKGCGRCLRSKRLQASGECRRALSEGGGCKEGVATALPCRGMRTEVAAVVCASPGNLYLSQALRAQPKPLCRPPLIQQWNIVGLVQPEYSEGRGCLPVPFVLLAAVLSKVWS